MKAKVIAATASLAAAGALAACAHENDGDRVTLIEGGHGLDNWNATGDANWHVAEGAIVASAKNATKHASGPFALRYSAGVNGARGGVIKWRKVQIRAL